MGNFKTFIVVIHLAVCGRALSSSDKDLYEKSANSFSSNGTDSDRSAKLFPYFLIQFPNEPCTGSSGSGGGVCVSAKECRQGGGMTTGTCAQGFGACCRYTKTCGEDGGDIQVRENSTDIKSNNQSCRFVLPKMRGICQVRLDFTEFVFGQGSPTGECSSTKLEIRGGVFQRDLCGNMTGQHLYLTYENADKLYLNAAEPTSDTDVYSIRVSYIRCNSRSLVPSHCTQYYTGASGEIRSFNWPQQQLNNQDYTICIAHSADNSSVRQGGIIASSHQKIHWSTCNNEPNDFFVSGKRNDLRISDPSQCDTDFIQIFGGNRQCGNLFQNETITSLPYLLYVRFDDREMDMVGKGSSTGDMTVSKPREGCSSLNTRETKCVEDGKERSLIEERAEIVDGGVCRCVNVPRENNRRLKADVGNTGFCLSYRITTDE